MKILLRHPNAAIIDNYYQLDLCSINVLWLLKVQAEKLMCYNGESDIE